MSKFKVAPLKGFKSFRAMQAFHTLMLGLNYLPKYIGRDYVEFYASIAAMSEPEQERMVREAALFVEIQKDEMDAILSFALDSNGIPFDDTNRGNLGPAEQHEALVAVCLEIGKIKVTLVSEAEKKKSADSALT